MGRWLAYVHDWERIGCGPPPPMDQTLGALVTMPVLREPSYPNRKSKIVDARLTRMHGAVAIKLIIG